MDGGIALVEEEEVKLSLDVRKKIVRKLKGAGRGDLTFLAEKYGVTPSYMSYLRRKAGIKPMGPGRPKGVTPDKLARAKAMLAQRQAGRSYQEIADAWQVSKQRVQQILGKAVVL